MDAATSEMLADYYVQRAKASDVRQEAKRREIEAYGREAAAERDRMLRDAKQLELQADILDLRAESELFSSRAKLLRDRSELMETAPSHTDTNATAPATTASDLADVTPPSTAARATDTIQPGDRLMIEARGVFPEEPIAQEYVVEQGGTVPLGPAYGRVPLVGLTLVEAELKIKEFLEEYVQNPQVQVTRSIATSVPPRPQAAAAATSPPSLLPPKVEMIRSGDGVTIELLGVPANTAGPYEFIVERDGALALGGSGIPYGRVQVAGLSRDEAEVAIEDHLRQFLEDPQVRVRRKPDALQTQIQSLRAEIRSMQDQLDRLQEHSSAD
jgi:protein involved in polysaccharide export with SLBB domain